jgi:hypothetical protein
MKAKNKGSIITQRQFDGEENARIKTKEYFITGQINSEVAIFILRLLGFSVTRAKEIVRQWIYEKRNEGSSI